MNIRLKLELTLNVSRIFFFYEIKKDLSRKFLANSGKQFKNNEMNIGWAQVALGESFCYGRHIGDGKDVHMKKDKMDMIYKNMRGCFHLI